MDYSCVGNPDLIASLALRSGLCGSLPWSGWLSWALRCGLSRRLWCRALRAWLWSSWLSGGFSCWLGNWLCCYRLGRCWLGNGLSRCRLCCCWLCCRRLNYWSRGLCSLNRWSCFYNGRWALNYCNRLSLKDLRFGCNNFFLLATLALLCSCLTLLLTLCAGVDSTVFTAASLLALGFGLLLHRSNNHDHVAAVLLWRAFDEAEFRDVFREALKQTRTHLWAGLLTSTEHDHDLDLVAGAQEALNVTLFGLIVMGIDLEAETDLLENCVRLVTTSVASLHVRLVLELAVIHELAHWWTSVRCNLNEIEVCFLSKAQCNLKADNSDLFPRWSDESNLGNTDSIVDARLADVRLLI